MFSWYRNIFEDLLLFYRNNTYFIFHIAKHFHQTLLCFGYKTTTWKCELFTSETRNYCSSSTRSRYRSLNFVEFYFSKMEIKFQRISRFVWNNLLVQRSHTIRTDCIIFEIYCTSISRIDKCWEQWVLKPIWV